MAMDRSEWLSIDGNCNHDDDPHHHEKGDGDRDEMALLMETKCIEIK